jgi:hypothetical protein
MLGTSATTADLAALLGSAGASWNKYATLNLVVPGEATMQRRLQFVWDGGLPDLVPGLEGYVEDTTKRLQLLLFF